MKNKKFLDLIFSHQAKQVVGFLFVFFAVTFLLFLTSTALAQDMTQGLGQFTNETGLSATPLPVLIGRIVRIVISFLGLIAVVIVLYGGFIWMTSGGDTDKIDRAKKLMRAGLIGLLIIVLAYALATFIIYLIGRIIGPGNHGGLGCTIGDINGCYRCVGPDPGHWIYDSTLPGCGLPPDAFSINKILTTHGQGGYNNDVYLCSAVQPMFNHWVDGNVIQQLAQANRLKIVDPQNNIVSGTWESRSNMSIFKHPNLFVPNTTYRAFLPKDIADTNGKLLQRCQADGGCPYDSGTQSYVWTFTTGVDTDNVKPYITSTYPIFKKTDPTYPDRNVSRKPIIEVNFSEPIDATTVVDKDGNLIAGNIWVAEIDGQDGSIIKTLSASDWSADIREKGFRFYLKGDNVLTPFTWYRVHVGNIADLCNNAMDPAMEWEFQTNDRAPGVESYYPTGTQVCPDTKIAIIFNTTMYEQDVTLDVFQGGQNVLHGEIKPSQVGPPYSVNGVGGRFYVVDNNDNPIDNHFRVFTFDPDTDLLNNTAYQVKVTTDLIINTNGDTLKQNWNFTTATPETCLCAPWITYINPNSGPKGQCVTVNGECFTGTPSQPATPKDGNINFIFKDDNNNPVSVTSTVQNVTDNNLTTIVPITSYPDIRPNAQLTIKYGPPNNSELTSNLSEFYINRPGEANGPCLWSIRPDSGYATTTSVTLNGIRFGPGNPATDGVFFYNQQKIIDCPGGKCSWTSTVISNTFVPGAAQSGDVVVVTDRGTSNGIHFEVTTPGDGAGDPCYYENVCLMGVKQCNNPTNYFCLVDQTDCRCCCRPSPNSCQSGLTCMADQGACTGSSRGLCCGCQSDDQCGSGSGCGILDPNRCCYPNPTIESKSPDANETGVCKNTSVQVIFNQEMDPASLSPANISFKQCSDQNCTFSSLVPTKIIVDQYPDTDPKKTGFTIYPRGCLLEANTWYQVNVNGKQVGGEMGDGVRSVKGVSMLGTVSWVFQTNDNLCVIDRVVLNPTSADIIVGQAQHYSASAFDGDKPVCVPSFDWDSSQTSVATVSPDAGLETVATGVNKGQTIITGSVQVGGMIGYQVKGEGTLNVHLTGLAVVDDGTCSPSQQRYPSPNPRPNNQQACTNIKISARFNKNVDDDKINDTDLIKVLNCGTDPQCVNPSKVIAKPSRGIWVYPYTTSTEEFVFEPLQDLSPNAYYRVIVPGGDNGVLGEDGSTMDRDYIWNFKTRDNDQACPIESVMVTPVGYIISKIGGEKDYRSSGLGPNCQMLTGDFSWQWESTTSTVASVNPVGPGPNTTSTALAVGETNITATTGNKSNFGHLVVATIPTVIDQLPRDGATNVCQNALIRARFDQLMDHTTLNADNVALWQWKGGVTSSSKPGNWLKNLAFKIRDLFLNITQAQIQPPPGSWVKVPGQVVSHDVLINQGMTTTVFIPDHVLDPNTAFTMQIGQKVKSKYGVSLAADVNWKFTTGAQVCHIDHVLVDPSSALFSKSNQAQNFSATVYTRDNQAIVPVPPEYTWTWSWVSSQNNIVSVTGQPDKNPSIGTGTSDGKNGQAILTATATDNLQPAPTVASGNIPVRVYLCENPWVYDNATYNFELTYCRDGNPLLPVLTNPVSVPVPPSGNLKLHLLFNVSGKPDIIGLMVYDNFDHLTPLEWYKANVSNPGGPNSTTVDGYQALVDGRTTYVNATNIGFINNSIYSNIFLISYNNNAAPETKNINSQLVQNWQFNMNTRADKDKLVRDLERVYHFNQFRATLNKYYQANRSYPSLLSGSYIKSMSVSRWPSWQQTLAQVLGAPLPIDPLNTFVNGTCANCTDSNYNPPNQCSGTCYNPAPNEQRYQCLANSHVYQYVHQPGNPLVSPSGVPESYSVYSNLEYGQPSYWQHNCGSYNTANLCAQHHWCYWSSNQCQAKPLNYNQDPCSSPSTCACFNMRYQPAAAWGGQTREMY
jgi:hypothetical protein